MTSWGKESVEKQMNIAKEIASLPPDAQRQVRDFVAFLKARYPYFLAVEDRKSTSMTDEPFIGMWRNREDMQESSAWVRDLRRREWGPKS
jgi:hypothetical protein